MPCQSCTSGGGPTGWIIFYKLTVSKEMLRRIQLFKRRFHLLQSFARESSHVADPGRWTCRSTMLDGQHNSSKSHERCLKSTRIWSYRHGLCLHIGIGDVRVVVGRVACLPAKCEHSRQGNRSHHYHFCPWCEVGDLCAVCYWSSGVEWRGRRRGISGSFEDCGENHAKPEVSFHPGSSSQRQ